MQMDGRRGDALGPMAIPHTNNVTLNVLTILVDPNTASMPGYVEGAIPDAAVNEVPHADMITVIDLCNEHRRRRS